jgi:uncharacterized protein (TIGR02646 family)
MITIIRGLAPPTVNVYTDIDPVTQLTRAEQEREEAIAFFTANYANEQKLTKEAFRFAIYKDKKLVAALEAVFGKKCAYCESCFAHVTPKDIEHFRPKSEVDTGTRRLKPGYYWLASEWDNLLVSCPDCNRTREHEVPGQPARVHLGKAMQFPLADEAKRVRSHNAVLADEEPFRLLINPCTEQPSDYLTFDDQGLIHSRDDANTQPNERGRISIAAYALQRKGLVEARLNVLDRLRFQIELLRYLVRMHNVLIANGIPADDVARNADQIRAVRDDLAGMMSQDAPYLAMLREWIITSRGAPSKARCRSRGAKTTKVPKEVRKRFHPLLSREPEEVPPSSTGAFMA